MIEFVPIMFFASFAAVLCTVAVQVGSVRRARAAGEHDAEYRQLLREANEAQARMSESLDRAVAEIAALRTRIESTERLLQEVG